MYVSVRHIDSARLMPIALTLMRTSLGPGAGTSVSRNSRTSGPPAFANLIVRDIVGPFRRRPCCQSMEADLWPRVLSRDHFANAFVEDDMVAPGAREKDFVSWGACPGDMESPMELRHLRYFIAVAEEGSLTLAAEKRLHTAQPSLSRQIRDLEYKAGVQLMSASVHGIELTAAGRAFLDHARLALTQVDAAVEAARRAAQPAKPTFPLGFLTGKEIDWLPEGLPILHDELPNIEVTG